MTMVNYELNSKYLSDSEFIKSLPSCFESCGVVLHNQRNQVRLMESPAGRLLVCKRFKRPMLHQRVYYTIFTSKARRAYDYGLRMLDLGISTPEPVAYIEVCRGGLIEDVYFLSEYCEGEDLKNVYLSGQDYKELTDSLAGYIVRMHENGFLHGDINLSNILYIKTDTGYSFFAIDTNRSVFAFCPTRNECLDNLMRLSHERTVIKKIVSAYAVIRGWNADECVESVVKRVERYELRRKIKSILFG